MALSRVIKIGDGSTDLFTLDFAMGYIKASDITCRVGTEVDGSGKPIYRALTFVTETLVRVAGTPAGAGVQIIFERTVNEMDTIVNYSDGDVMDEVNLDLSFKQLMMLMHQVLDGRFERFDSDIDHGGFRITGLGDPVDPTDAANKQYVDNRIAYGAANASAAAASAAAALASQNAANAYAISSAGSATASLNSATASTNARDVSVAARDAALAYRNETEGFRNQASASAAAADTSTSNAFTYRNQAQAAASTAITKSENANVSAINAGVSETNAKTSENNAKNSETASQTAQIRAYNWAQEAEDVTVNDSVRTGNSSFHWSRKAQAAATAAALSSATAASTVSAIAYLSPDRNVLDNPDLLFWGRNTTQSTNGVRSVDRFSFNGVGSSFVVTRQLHTPGQTLVPGNPSNFAQIVVTSVPGAANYVTSTQSIEYASTLAGRVCTVTFWARSTVNGKRLGIELEQFFGSGGSSTVTGIGGQWVTLSTLWTKYSLLVTIPSISGKVIGSSDTLRFNFWFDGGSNFNARTNSIGQQSGTFQISRISLVPGDARGELDPTGVRSFQAEHVRLIRFYQVAVANGRVFSSGSGVTASFPLNWPQMRAPPTVSIINGGTASGLQDAQLISTSTIGARFELISASTGDVYCIDRMYGLDAEF